MPSIRGIRTSMRTTSGASRGEVHGVDTVAASPTTSSPAALEDHPEACADQLLVVDHQHRVTGRPTVASSATGSVDADREAAVRRGPGDELAAVQARALAHAHQAVAGAVEPRLAAATVIEHLDAPADVGPVVQRAPRTRRAPACRRTLVSASWTIR